MSAPTQTPAAKYVSTRWEVTSVSVRMATRWTQPARLAKLLVHLLNFQIVISHNCILTNSYSQTWFYRNHPLSIFHQSPWGKEDDSGSQRVYTCYSPPEECCGTGYECCFQGDLLVGFIPQKDIQVNLWTRGQSWVSIASYPTALPDVIFCLFFPEHQWIQQIIPPNTVLWLAVT